MDATEARARLGLYRPGLDDAADPWFADALELAERDPELSRWLAREQAFDATLAAKLNAAPVPPELKGNLLALGHVVAPPVRRWRGAWRPGLAAAAVVTFLAALRFLHPVPSTETAHVPTARATPAPADAGSLENFRAEMIAFVQLAPPLEFKSPDPAKLLDFLRQEQGPAGIQVPAGLLRLPGFGCRMLSFRGHKVALICFLREDGRLVHLLATDGATLPALDGTRAHPQIGLEGAWMTAAWKADGMAYLVAVQGNVPLLDTFLAQTVPGSPSAGGMEDRGRRPSGNPATPARPPGCTRARTLPARRCRRPGPASMRLPGRGGVFPDLSPVRRLLPARIPAAFSVEFAGRARPDSVKLRPEFLKAPRLIHPTLIPPIAMIRKAFVMSVHAGSEEEYEARHRPIWPELEQTLREHGVHNYSIFLHPETRQLFGYVEIEDEARWASIAETAVCRRWWTHMREVMPTHPDHRPVSTELREVFHLF